MTDYTFKKEDVDEKDKKKKEQESDEDRCKRLKRWKAAYKADKSKDKKVCLSLSFHRLSTALLAPDTAFALRAGGAWHRWLRSSCTGHPARPGAPDKTRHTLTLYSTACGSESGGWEPGWALMTDLSRRNVAAAAAAAAAAAPGTLPHNPDGALLMFLSARALAAQARAAADIGVEPYFNRRRLCCQAPRSAPSGRKGAILDPESLSSRSLTSVPVHRWSG